MTDMGAMDWKALFDALYPGFFDQPSIRALPQDGSWEEMALSLPGFSGRDLAIPVPDGVSFGIYKGGLQPLRAEVRRVDESWPGYYDGKHRVYCAFDGDRVASFCLLEDMGTYRGLRVAGPGCVGTLPEYRRRGIGLRMVQNATALLAAEGYDIGYIHYTGVGPWYARLGYRTVLRWNRDGVVDQGFAEAPGWPQAGLSG